MIDASKITVTILVQLLFVKGVAAKETLKRELAIQQEIGASQDKKSAAQWENIINLILQLAMLIARLYKCKQSSN